MRSQTGVNSKKSLYVLNDNVNSSQIIPIHKQVSAKDSLDGEKIHDILNINSQYQISADMK